MRAVVLPAGAALLILALLIGSVLRISTTRSDDLALARQDNLISFAIRQSLTSIANDQEASTLWDDAVLKLRQRPIDYEWIDNNLGIWFHTYYHHDETYLVDPRGEVIYGMMSGRRAEARAFDRLAPKARPLLADLRSAIASGSAAPEGAPGQTKGIADLAMVGNHPAIISIKPVVPETDAVHQDPTDAYLHVSVRYLDGSFLTALQSKFGIDKAEFTPRAAEGAFVALKDRTGHQIGSIIWTPFRPGGQVAAQMVPALLAALALIAGTLVLLLLQQKSNRARIEETKAKIEHLAYHDALTGLPNRAAFRNTLERAVAGANEHRNVALLLLDLDHFKLINDAFGHPAGDAVICAFADKLSAIFTSPHLVARLGGDEFAVVIDGDADLEKLCEAVLSAVAEPCEFLGQQLHIGASIGIARATHATKGEELLRKADIALYRAKGEGRNCYRFFDFGMDESIRRRTTIEEELRGAMQHDEELGLFFQPIFHPGVARPAGFEALLRWHRNGQQCWTADEFIPVAEESGLIVPLGEWVMRQACLASLKLDGAFVAINLSPLQCRSMEFVESLLQIVRETGARPDLLHIEVTERALIEGREDAAAAIEALRAFGFKVVLEDFGAGYSSIKYVRSLQFDKLKLDRSLLEHLGPDRQAADLVGAMIGLGKVVGLRMAAEGVESREQRDLLVAAGCSEVQGHFFAPALPIDSALRLLDTAAAAA